jgi:rhomboid protease GluP
MGETTSSTYDRILPLGELSPDECIAIAIEAAKALKWKITLITDLSITATSQTSADTPVDEISLKIEDQQVIISVKHVTDDTNLISHRNVENWIAAINRMISSLSREQLDRLVFKFRLYMSLDKESIQHEDGVGFKKSITELLTLFKPVPGYFISPYLLNINCGIFLLMAVTGAGIFEPDTKTLVSWGANYGPLTLSGEWWRLISSCFIHIGFLHLFTNMIAFVYIAAKLEAQLGKLRFAVAYILTGIAGSATSLYWHDSIVSAGASGSIFGLYGLFFALLTTNVIDKSSRKDLLGSLVFFILLNLLSGMRGPVDNAAHIGGLLSGLVTGYIFYPGLKKAG